MTIAPQSAAIVLDFDGTVTEDDMLDRVCWEFGDRAVYAEVDAALDRGEIRLVDDIERKLATVRAPLDEVVAWMRSEARIRAGFSELVAWARTSGRRVAVVTSGFHELVEPVLGEDVELFANRLEACPGGWCVRFADLDDCEACGQPCKRATVARLGPVVYVGDGYSDRCVAHIAGRVFARDGLARYLEERGVEYEPFDDLHDVVDALERERLAA